MHELSFFAWIFRTQLTKAYFGKDYKKRVEAPQKDNIESVKRICIERLPERFRNTCAQDDPKIQIVCKDEQT